MARTAILPTDPAAQKVWATKVALDSTKKSFFNGMIGKEGSSMPVITKTDLETKPGDEVTTTLIAKLRGKPVEGSEKLAGRAMRLQQATHKMRIDKHRQAVNVGDVMDQKRVSWSIPEQARDRLSDYMAEIQDEQFRQPTGRYRGYGYFDFDILGDVEMQSIDGFVLPQMGPGYLNLPSAAEQQGRRLLHARRDPRYAALVAQLGEKNSQDAWHIHTAEIHGLFCFLTMDFKLLRTIEAASRKDPVKSLRTLVLTPEDFGAFEKRLQDVQMAFGREDRAALMTLMTPEMTGYLVEELENNARDGVVNKISDPRLLQGDLSEAWAEPDAEYATVAMRFSLIDVVVDRATGRTVSGSLTTPAEAVELWTFRRRPAGAPGDWMLSAIQQVS